jgi:hypothetical protein
MAILAELCVNDRGEDIAGYFLTLLPRAFGMFVTGKVLPGVRTLAGQRNYSVPGIDL